VGGRTGAIAIGLGALAVSGSIALMAGAPAEAVSPRDAANQLFALTNIDRTSNGRPALARDPRLGTVAEARSQDMITRDYFSHQIPPNDTTVVDILESLGVPFKIAGENIAWNNANDFATVQSAGEDFIRSPHHRENLLDDRWDRMGTGVAEGSGKKMYTVVFMQSAQQQAPGASAGPTEPQRTAAPPRVHGERVELAGTRTGLLTSLVNAMVRLFLNL
jgi:uncharacterized protein YkwD